MPDNGTIVTASHIIREPNGSIVLPGTHGIVRYASKRLGQNLWLVEWETLEACYCYDDEFAPSCTRD
jgi:hypothetical protein